MGLLRAAPDNCLTIGNIFEDLFDFLFPGFNGRENTFGVPCDFLSILLRGGTLLGITLSILLDCNSTLRDFANQLLLCQFDFTTHAICSPLPEMDRLRWRSTRQGEADPCTGIRLRVCPDAAAMCLDNRTCKIKSQSRAFGLFNGFCRTIKAIEDMWQILGFDPGPSSLTQIMTCSGRT